MYFPFSDGTRHIQTKWDDELYISFEIHSIQLVFKDKSFKLLIEYDFKRDTTDKMCNQTH